ncbi:MAG: ABC transporter permease [Bryobacterales bacterium]|nr:ABC transporter permease [Bryobacterales bacterium]
MKRLRLIFLTPAAALLAGLFVAPLAILAVYTVLTRGAYGGVSAPFTVENWMRLADPLYLAIVWRSFVVAGVSTAICVVLGFPLALFIARSGARKNLYLALVMLPFWTSFLVRTYAWMFLLRDTGLINTMLLAMGVISEPLPLLYNWGAVIVGLVYGYLPFLVLPLFATLERMDPALVEASADLGAGPWQTVWRVILPLSAPGLRAGAILVFIPCLGAYLTPDLLGGGKTILIGTLIQNQFTSARDWPFGSAVALGLMGLVMVLLWLHARRGGEPLV